MSEPHVWLTYEQAVDRLPDAERIHVFTRSGIGAEWDRADVLAMLGKARIEEAGPMARRMGHGLAAWDEPSHCWLVETAS